MRSNSRPFVKNTSSFAEESDTGSMLLRPSSEWFPSSYINTASLIRKHTSGVEETCCYRRIRTKEEVSLK